MLIALLFDEILKGLSYKFLCNSSIDHLISHVVCCCRLIEKLTFQNLVSRADKLGQSFSQFERILNQKNGSSVFKNPV
jgi:hypothetical protein